MNWVEGKTGISFVKAEATVKPRSFFKQVYGDDWHREAGKIGGIITAKRYGPEFYSAIGKLSSRQKPTTKLT